MELVINVWPIVVEDSGVIQRFAARAYAMDSDDAVIARTLKSLASADFALARQFPVPQRFKLVAEHGELSGAVTVAVFNESQAAIIEGALKILESELPEACGVGLNSEGRPRRVHASFPKDPYFVVTFLIEDATGNLSIHSPV